MIMPFSGLKRKRIDLKRSKLERERFRKARRKAMAIKCPLCNDGRDLSVNKDTVEEHLIVTKDNNNHFHVHGPIHNKAMIQDFVTFILKESGIAFDIVPGRRAETEKNKSSETD
jgi:hypothetical protein